MIPTTRTQSAAFCMRFRYRCSECPHAILHISGTGSEHAPLIFEACVRQPMPRSSQTFSLRDALLEQARREMLRRKQTTTRSISFPAWLDEVSPDFTWDWAYLQYIQAHLQKVTDGEIRKLMLFMPPRHGKPIAVHARILMGDGSRKRLADIQTGDTVISHTGAVRKVLAVFEQGMLPVLKITTSTGRTTTAAYDHPFLTTEGWKAARDLAPGMVLANVPQPACHAEPDGRTNEEYRLAGYFIGDGNTTSSGTATGINARVTCFDPIQADDLAHCAGVMGWGVRLAAQKGSYAFSGGVRTWLRACDLAGKVSREKRVPSWVFQGTPEQIGHFLGAYLACDGSVSKKGAARSDAAVEYYSVNRDLLADVQHLLLRLGIQSRVQLKQGRYLGQIHYSWRLTITSQDDVARFARAIPIVGAKAQTLAAWNVQRRRFDETLLAATRAWPTSSAASRGASRRTGAFAVARFARRTNGRRSAAAASAPSAWAAVSPAAAPT